MNRYLDVTDMEDDFDVIASLNGVDIYANQRSVAIKHPRFKFEWGDFKSNAGPYRRICEMHKDILPVASTGVLFELLWSVSNYWLWKYTTDKVFTPRSISGVAKNKDRYDINYKDKLDVSQKILTFIESHKLVQDNIIKNRNKVFSDSPIERKIERINIEDYRGSYIFNNILYSDEHKNKYKQVVEENDIDVDVDSVVDSCFSRSDSYDGDGIPIVYPDSSWKPQFGFLGNRIGIEDEVIGKIIETSPVRDDINVEYFLDYDSGDVEITVK